MRRRRGGSALSCSKKIVLASYLLAGGLSAAAVLGTFLTPRDMGPVVTLAGLAWGETAAANGFYFWKARAENRIKLTKQMAAAWADKYGIDAVARLAEIGIRE